MVRFFRSYKCRCCGGQIVFRTIDGRKRPIHI